MRRIALFCLLIFGAFFSISGCAPKNTFVLLPNPDGSVGEISVTTKKGTQVVSQPNYATEVSSPDKIPSEPGEMDEGSIKDRFGKALEAQPVPPVTFTLFFKSGKDSLTDESEELIPDILSTIKARKSTDVSVVGHTDTKGSAEYNRKLSLKRAILIKELLVSRGIDAGFLDVDSHGESNPVVPTGDNVAEPKNRRVEVTVR